MALGLSFWSPRCGLWSQEALPLNDLPFRLSQRDLRGGRSFTRLGIGCMTGSCSFARTGFGR
jgi:hypothetical protein